jgi:hypothetical protein
MSTQTTLGGHGSCEKVVEVGDLSAYRCPAGCFHLRLRDVTLRLDENDWRHLLEVCRRADALNRELPPGTLPS